MKRSDDSGAGSTKRADAYKLRDLLVEYTLRSREFEANRNLYDSLLNSVCGRQACSRGWSRWRSTLSDKALPPAKPVLRPQSTVILTALVFSLVAGIVIAFLMESLDTGLRSITQRSKYASPSFRRWPSFHERGVPLSIRPEH